MEGKGAARRRGGRDDRDGRTKALAVDAMVAMVATPRQRISVGGLISCFWRKKEGWWSVGDGSNGK